MIATLKSENGVSWTNFVEPEPEELAEFARSADITTLDAEFVVQEHRRPEVSIQPGYIMVMVHVPIFDRQSRVTTGVPLYLIARSNQLWTVQHTRIAVLDKLFQEYEKNQKKMEEYFHDGPVALALHIIDNMFNSAFDKIERLSKHIEIAEDAVFHGNERKMVEEISILMRDVMDFRKVVLPQIAIFAQPPVHELITPRLQTQWLRLHGQAQKLWDLLLGLYENIKELRDSTNSLIQHREKELLRLLTYYSTVTIPIFILLGPINPFLETTSPFFVVTYWIILGVLITTLIAIFIRFRGKHII